jgi:hypothetical protein
MRHFDLAKSMGAYVVVSVVVAVPFIVLTWPHFPLCGK